MAYDSSGQQSSLPYPHLSPAESFVPLGLASASGFYSAANAPTNASQDGMQTTPWISSTHATENIALGWLSPSLAPEPFLNSYTFDQPYSEGTGCFPPELFFHSASCGLFDQLNAGAIPFVPTERILSRALPQSDASTGPDSHTIHINLASLSPPEQYIVRERLKGKTWYEIRSIFIRQWGDIKIHALREMLKTLRNRYCIIEYILPSRQHQSSTDSQSIRTCSACSLNPGPLNSGLCLRGANLPRPSRLPRVILYTTIP
jgi:hypothetical protein